MSKKPKPNSSEKTLGGKISAKKKTAKQNYEDSAKGKADNEEVINMVVNDEKWHCSIFFLVPQSPSLYISLTNLLSNLPDNFTVVNKDAIINEKDNKGPNKTSRKGSKTRKSSVRSNSKSSKQSGKSKSTKSKNKSKEKGEETENIVEGSNSEENCLKVGLAIKNIIVHLKKADFENMSRDIPNFKNDFDKSGTKNRRSRMSGSGDKFDIEKAVEANAVNENIVHRFVILLGFYDYLLPEVLTNLNLTLKAVINFRSVGFGKSNSNERLSTVTGKSKRKPSVKSKIKSADEKENAEYTNFFEKMSEFSNSTEYLEKCKDIIFLNYNVKSVLSRGSKFEMEHKSQLFDLFYKIKEAWVNYVDYKENLIVQNIPLSVEILKIDDAKVYSTMISMVPLECTSTAIVLHCVLEQIVWWNNEHLNEESDHSHSDFKIGIDTTSPSVPNILSKNRTPILINHRDEIKYSTFHLDLPEFDFEQISWNMFKKSPVYKLWERYPPHTEPVNKWYEFQLQKLQNSSNDCVYKRDRLFSIYLHHSLMSFLIFKTQQLSKTINEGDLSDTKLDNNSKLLLSKNEPEAIDINSNLFIKSIMHNILCQVPRFSLCQSYLPPEFFEIMPFLPDVAQEHSQDHHVFTNHLMKVISKELPVGSLLEKREFYKQEKLSKLTSFLICSEFLNLFEDLSKFNNSEIDRLLKYKFVEKLSQENLFQCLQSAFEAFSNVNYDYFAVSDSILLWFNNSERQTLCSSTLKGVLHTQLGFRDFYLYKLKEHRDVGDLVTEDAVGKESRPNDDTVVDDPESLGNHSIIESFTDYNPPKENEKPFIIDGSKPTVVYDLGSLWMESSESFSNFFSDDSSFVTVKRTTYFDGKRYITVKVNKNNTSLRYDLYPNSTNDFAEIFISVNKILNISCICKWSVPHKSSVMENIPQFPDKSDTFSKTINSKLDCRLNIRFPSGLFVEVVPTDSIFGPFYVRQSYLVKGPNCSTIWEEAYRCYFNNGMILIFRVDCSVDILYSNGTIVKCISLEKFETENNNKSNSYSENPAEGADLNQELGTNKGGTKSQQKNKDKIKAHASKSEGNVKKPYKEDKKSKDKPKRGSKTAAATAKEEKFSIKEETINQSPVYKIAQHSVLSWDGSHSQYVNDHCQDSKKCLDLRIAFDAVNQELYWQRNDGMSSLQVAGKHFVKFPDSSRTTLFTIHDKELWVDNNYGILYNHSGELVRIESLTATAGKMHIELNNSLDAKNGNSFSKTDGSDTNSFDMESSEEMSFVYVEKNIVMEHKNYASVEYSNEKYKLKLNLPGNCCVTIDENGLFSFEGERHESITLFKNNLLVFEANVLNRSILSKSTTNLRFENASTVPQIFSQTEDSFGNLFFVDERGNTTYLPFLNSVNHNGQSKSDFHFAHYPQSVERLFVFNRDLTGYEMIHEVEQSNSATQEASTMSAPLVEGNSELHSFYLQTPVYRNKSEEYLMHSMEELVPSLIKRKDLLKPCKTPETIWFYPELSSVTKEIKKQEINAVQRVQKLKAMLILQRLKVIGKSLDAFSLFTNSLSKYIHDNVHTYQKYLSFYPEETRTEDDLKEFKKHREEFLGSKSYYLTDNLPVVLTGSLFQGKESNHDIMNIFSPSASKNSL